MCFYSIRLTTQKGKKFFWKNITNDAKDLYSEKYKHLLNNIKGDIKMERQSMSWVGRLILLNDDPNQSNTQILFNPKKFWQHFYTNRKIYPKIHLKSQGTWPKQILKKQTKAGDIKPPEPQLTTKRLLLLLSRFSCVWFCVTP